MTNTSTQHTYWLAWSATLLFFAGFYALLVPLPRYLEAIGLPDWQIGLVLGAFGVASLLGRPLSGLLADRWGQRRVLLLGAAALALGACGVSLTTDVRLLFGLRLLQAVGYVAFTTAGTALVVALTPLEQRGQRLALFGAAANVAITMTPAIVSALLTVAPLETAFFLSGGLALLTGGLAWFTGRTGLTQPRLFGWRALWQFPRQLWLPMFVTALFGLGFGAFFQFLPLLAERRDGLDAGLAYTCYGLSIIATRLLSGSWLDQVSLARVLTLATGLMVAGLLLLAFADSLLTLLGATLLIASGGGLFHPALLAHHARLLPGEPGRATAGFYVGFDMGIGAGSWLLGLVLQWWGLVGMYLAAAAVVAVVPLIIHRGGGGERRDFL
ncbi:MAG: MFS transporter [Chloroflexaceae bacterium]|jgi:MFS family permease|nr:MFS transporter [Chloroflexaceae bacterium]